MKVRFLVLAGLLLTALPVHAQSREMLRAVDQGQAQRLEAYNRVFLQEELYSAARSRIVSINPGLLLQDEVITITPFPDVKPIVITRERGFRNDVVVSWHGCIQLDPALASLGARFCSPITMLWWDLNSLGHAELSGSNRFRFSPAWRIDENDRPVRIAAGVVRDPGEVGLPPQTPEEIAEHKRLLQLERRAFGSVSARLELPTGRTYVVSPLRHTPRYAVVYELDKDKIVPIPFEAEDAATQTAEQRAKVQRYEAFRRSLPIEDKAILGDIE